MDLIAYLHRQFAYDAWANREVLTAVRTSDPSSRLRPLQLLAHIFSAERLWLERLQQQPQSLVVWPEFSLEECGTQAIEVGRLWSEYLNRIKEAQLSDTIHYQNTKGERFANTVVDIATHVITHSAYHRGQIASYMREHGQTPAYTDFIHAVRQGLIH